jgi:hypothetical protein
MSEFEPRTEVCIYCKRKYTHRYDNNIYCSIGCELNHKYPDDNQQEETPML